MYVADKALPGEMTLSQLLHVLEQRGLHQGSSILRFNIKMENKKKESSNISEPPMQSMCPDLY